MKKIFASLLFLAACSTLSANDGTSWSYWPGADYDPGVPTHQSVLGYAAGERISRWQDVRRFFQALADARPGQVEIVPYARSWQGRELFYVVIGTEENVRRREEIRSGMKALSDPRTLSAERASQLISELPGVTWISYGVHGNEISSTDAAMVMAYHLLASRNDPVVEKILGESLVILDPVQNPDGRVRYIHGFESAEGLATDPSRLSAEHVEPWPNGRTNHYLFDLNRDWFAITQPETHGKVAAFLDWYPLVFIDAHEMGGDQTYYFAPQRKPFNPHTTDSQFRSLNQLGENNARWFDYYGFDYFTREVFDGFYPGYGDSWPKFHGSIASTYEQASARALAFRKYDGRVMHFRDTVRQHFVASVSTAEYAAMNREQLLRDFYQYRQSAMEEGAGGETRSYIFPVQADMPGVHKLAGLLALQGIEVMEARSEFRACGESYAAGAYVVDAAQPSGRLVRNLLEEQTPMDPDYMKEQERRRSKKLEAEIYDVTGWSLPAMYNLAVDRCDDEVSGDFDRRDSEQRRAGRFMPADDAIAFVVPWGTAAAGRLLSRALLTDMAVKSSDRAFVIKGRRFPAGSLVFKKSDNDAALEDHLRMLARETGADVVAVDSSWTDEGPNFGSDRVVTMKRPVVAMAWDYPTSPYSAGNTRFVIERQLDLPVTAVRTRSLVRGDLAEFDVIILPENSRWYGSYDQMLGKQGVDNLAQWVRQGGTLLALGSATRFIADPEVDLISIRREDAHKADSKDAKKNAKNDEQASTVAGTLIRSEDEYLQSLEPERQAPDRQPGVLVRAHSDEDHWLSAGLAESLNVLVRGNDIYTPLTVDQGVNVVRFAAADELLVSGYVWQENREQMAFKPFVAVERKGRGYVIAVTQDPTVRAYLDGLNGVLLNAIFRASAHAARN